MPALPSSPISSVSDAPALTVPEAAGGLPAALAAVPDPRARRGVRHRLSVVVTAAVCAVVAGYRSYAAIAEWVADVPDQTAKALGIAADRRPSEAWIRRLPQALDRSQIRTSTGAQVMAAQRNAAIGALRVTGVRNIAAANRYHARDSTGPLTLFGII
jgi:hypothetical protein